MPRSKFEKDKVYLCMTIDWERDAGIWHHSSVEIDYGGILVGTDAITQFLDRFGLSCTWLVEMHKDRPAYNLPGCYPDLVRTLAARKGDEIGLHIHWGKQGPDNKAWNCLHSDDTPWVDASIQFCKTQLESMNITPISFRGGAFLQVPGLPDILHRYGFLVDSSTLQGHSFRKWPLGQFSIGYWQAIAGLGKFAKQPYQCQKGDCEKEGESGIIEFPANFDPESLMRYKCLQKKLFWELQHCTRPRFITLFFHSYQFTDPHSGPDLATRIDQPKVDGLSRLIERVLAINGVEFVTLGRAGELFKKVRDLA